MNRTLKEAHLLILLSLLGMGGSWLFHPDLPAWDPMEVQEGEITVEDAIALQAVTWIDARSEEEFLSDHIPEAILLNEDHWEELFERFIQSWDGESTLVVYCDSRTCAASKGVAERLKAALGTQNVLILKGGWQTWQTHRK